MKIDCGPLANWPEPCEVAARRPHTVDLGTLSKEKKQYAWRWIKEKHPDLAALLTDLYTDIDIDPEIEKTPCQIENILLRSLVVTFGCSILVEAQYLPPDLNVDEKYVANTHRKTA